MFKKKITPNRIFNWIMTLISIIFLLVLLFKYGYTPSNDMIIDNSSVKINLDELQNTIQNQTQTTN